MKRLLKSILARFGYEIKSKSKVKKDVPSGLDRPIMADGLRRLATLFPRLSTIVDVGAAAGGWTRLACKFWPDASFVMFEPLAERREILSGLVRNNSKIFHLPFAAGETDGQQNFLVSDDLDGSGMAAGKFSISKAAVVPVTTVSNGVKSLKLEGSYLVKLDTHGYEVPILVGCQDIQKDVEVFVIEVYTFHLSGTSLVFHEMCSRMSQMGYRLFDILDVMYRPKDHAFWQCDAVFIRNSHPVFKDNVYG